MYQYAGESSVLRQPPHARTRNYGTFMMRPRITKNTSAACQRLREEVSQVVRGSHERHNDTSRFDQLPDEEVAPLDVFGALMML